MTTESSTSGATTLSEILSCMNLSGYVGHMTIGYLVEYLLLRDV